MVLYFFVFIQMCDSTSLKVAFYFFSKPERDDKVQSHSVEEAEKKNYRTPQSNEEVARPPFKKWGP